MKLKNTNKINYDGSQLARYDYHICCFIFDTLKQFQGKEQTQRIEDGLAYIRSVVKGEKYLKSSELYRIMEYWIAFRPYESKKPLVIITESFELTGNSEKEIGDEGCKKLIQILWPTLQSLSLNKNNISDEGCQYLSSITWSGLQNLSLGYNNISDEGCKYLVSIQRPELSYFSLSHNNISDEGCKYLSSITWSGLQILNILDNQITKMGCQYLGNKAKFPSLTTLFLKLPSEERKECEQILEKAFPDIAIWETMLFFQQ